MMPTNLAFLQLQLVIHGALFPDYPLAEAADTWLTQERSANREQVFLAQIDVNNPFGIPPNIRHPTAEESRRIQRLIDESDTATEDSRFEDSLRKLNLALGIANVTWGETHPFAAEILLKKTISLRNAGETEAALELASAAVEAFLQSLGENHESTVEAMLEVVIVHAAAGDPHARLDAATRMLKSARAGGHTELVLLSLGNIANAAVDLGDAKRELEVVEELLGIARRAKHLVEDSYLQAWQERRDALVSEPASTLYREALAQDRQGDTTSALTLLDQAVERYSEVLGRTNSLTLTARHARATILMNNGQGSEVEQEFRDILEAREEAELENTVSLIRTKESLGLLLSNTGRGREATQLLREAWIAQIRWSGLMSVAGQTAQNNFIDRLQNEGRLEEAERLARELVEASGRMNGTDHPNTLQFTANHAHILSELGRYEDAEAMLDKAIPRLIEISGYYHTNTLSHILGYGWNLLRQGRHAEAISVFQDGLEGMESVLGSTAPQTISALLFLIEGLLAAGNDDAQALRLLEKAYVIAENDPRLAAHRFAMVRMLAEADLRVGNLQYALQGLRYIQDNHLKSVVAAADAHPTTRSHFAARAHRIGLLVAETAWQLAEMGQAESAGTAPQALRDEAFLAVQTGSDGEAGSAIARAASRNAALGDGLGEVVRRLETAQNSLRIVDVRLSEITYDPRLDNASRAAQRRDLFSDREGLEGEIEAARAQLQRDYPTYFTLIAPQPVEISDLMHANSADSGLLGADEALILISPGLEGARGKVWAVTSEGAAWAELGLDDDALIGGVGQMRASLDAGRAGLRAAIPLNGASVTDTRQIIGFERDIAHKLFVAIFGAPEIVALIADKSNWILVPQGPFLSLPFAGLVTETPQGSDSDPSVLRSTAWLGLDKALSVLPSVATLKTLRSATKPVTDQRGRNFFGIGDPDFEGAEADERAIDTAAGSGTSLTVDLFHDSLGLPDAVRALPRLPGTLREVRSMAAMLGAGPDDILIGSEANETRLAHLNDSGRLQRADIILFATHGLVTGDFDGLAEPALALSPPNCGPQLITVSNGSVASEETIHSECGSSTDAGVAEADWRGDWIDDGLLTASEVAVLSLDAEWVILSACNTAAGGAVGAEGLSGLASAFFYAGSRALLVSHWPVSDTAAARLTTDTMARLEDKPGLTRAEALRDAMSALATDGKQAWNAHPAYWAPFHLVGTP